MKQNLTLTQFSHLGRAVDPRYPSNRLIVVLATLAGVLVGLGEQANGLRLGEAAPRAVSAAFVVFLAWAVARELDPDVNFSATVAAVLAFVAYVGLGSASLWPVLALMMLARICNGVVGLPPLVVDYGYTLAVVALALGSGMGVVAWIGVAVLLYQASIGNHRWVALGAAGVALAMGGYALTQTVEREGAAGVLIGAGVIGALAVPALLHASAALTSMDDLNRAPLKREAVRIGQGVIWAGAGLLAVWMGSRGVVALTPLWAALAGVVVRWGRDSLG